MREAVRVMPRVGSVVRVTTRWPNINLFTRKEKPFEEFVKQGAVVRGDMLDGPDTFRLLTGNKNYPVSIVSLSAVVGLEFVKGKGDEVQGPSNHTKSAVVKGSVDKKTGKQKEYTVTRRGDTWFCPCDGFHFRKKCGHLAKSGL